LSAAKPTRTRAVQAHALAQRPFGPEPADKAPAHFADIRLQQKRSEVLYADFTDREHSLLVPGFGPANFTHGDSMWLARLGLNLRLGPTLAGH
jgi:hypothetical protein